MARDLFQRRILSLIAIGLFFLFGLVIRLFDVQAINASDYTVRVNNELYRTSIQLAPRGEITDINGIPFARSVSALNVVVDQTLVAEPKKVAQIAAPILRLPANEIESRVTGDKRWYLVARNATPAQWSALKDAFSKYNDSLSKKDYDKRIVGFYAERNYTREYPAGSLIASLVGFVNQEGDGAAGIESSLNSIIKGQDGKYLYANGYAAEIPGTQQQLVQGKAGASVRLTIDRDVQYVAQNAIAKAVKSSRAASGTVIVMDPKTGAIVAHATAPTFDPNNTKNVSLDLMRNPSVQDVYEPGSTGKVMTMAAALEEKTITPTTVFTVPYMLKRAGSTFHDHQHHPTEQLTTSGILAVSSNTGTIQVGETLSHDTLYSYLAKFGIGTKTGSGLPGESAGILRPVSNWSGTTAPTVAFGQGYSVTAMQATSVFATIANNGVRVSPTVIAGTSDASGHFTPTSTRTSTRVISEDTAIKLRLMMESVVSPEGTAPSAAIPGYRVAGKTGTAMRYEARTGGYTGYTASFIGFAPADAPRYVISVTLQAPHNGHYGGALCGPVFKKVMTFVLQSEHVPPTGTTVLPVALTQAELNKPRATQVSVKQ